MDFDPDGHSPQDDGIMAKVDIFPAYFAAICIFLFNPSGRLRRDQLQDLTRNEATVTLTLRTNSYVISDFETFTILIIKKMQLQKFRCKNSSRLLALTFKNYQVST